VLWNGSSVGAGMSAGSHDGIAPLCALLHEPFAALGSTRPELDASLAAHAVLGVVSDYLWSCAEPTAQDAARITRFRIDAARQHVGRADDHR